MAKKLPGMNREPVSRVQALKDSVPPAVVEPAAAQAPRGEGKPMQIVVPSETLRALKLKAAEDDTTVRELVLSALAAAGYPVPADELRDRRRG